ncbi:hypothetical protein JGU66_10005 [Myxococcaceae bacterium JPH2]|nr:hypothetical protein [Myxococcaceae bacterium JPH2]
MMGSHRVFRRMDIHSLDEVEKMVSLVTVFGRRAQMVVSVLSLAMMSACGGSREQFIGPRVLDACNASWPVCSQIAGCILGPESYAEGRFPGSTQLIVQVPEASTIKVHFYLEEVTAAGEETAIVFQEEGCRSRKREAITGKLAIDSMEKFGEFTREADVTGVGDHLIQIQSDMQARYVVKVDVTPLRNR